MFGSHVVEEQDIKTKTSIKIACNFKHIMHLFKHIRWVHMVWIVLIKFDYYVAYSHLEKSRKVVWDSEQNWVLNLGLPLTS